jgi:tripartite-type tricarboxylate transporter receptor subunit TctC
MMKYAIAMVSSAILSLSLFANSAVAQSYPVRPIKVTTVEPAGALDTVLRIITNGLSISLGQQLVVENRPSTTRPEDRIAKAEPDGYSLLYLANTLWLAPFLRAQPPYDVFKDFAPISLTVKGPSVVAITASLPVKSVAELVVLAKSKPGELNVSASGVGTSSHRAALLFQYVTGAKFTEIKYKGTAQALADVAAGNVHVTFATIVSSFQFVKSGRIKVLAVTSAQRSQLYPEVPTVASLGYPGFESVATHAFVAPARTPAAIVNRLSKEIVQFLSQSEARERIGNLGFEIVASSPEQLRAAMKTEMNTEGHALRAAGVRPE